MPVQKIKVRIFQPVPDHDVCICHLFENDACSPPQSCLYTPFPTPTNIPHPHTPALYTTSVLSLHLLHYTHQHPTLLTHKRCQLVIVASQGERWLSWSAPLQFALHLAAAAAVNWLAAPSLYMLCISPTNLRSKRIV